MKDSFKQRKVLDSVYCSNCGGWLCDVEIENGRTIQKCPKCGKKMVISAHRGSILVYEDRRKKTA